MRCDIGNDASALAENPVKNQINPRNMLIQREKIGNLVAVQMGCHIGILQQQLLQLQAAVGLPDPHRIALHNLVTGFTRQAGLSQRQQHALAVHQSAHPVEILQHTVWIDEQLIDHAGQAMQGKIKRDGRIRTNAAFDR